MEKEKKKSKTKTRVGPLPRNPSRLPERSEENRIQTTDETEPLPDIGPAQVEFTDVAENQVKILAIKPEKSTTGRKVSKISNRRRASKVSTKSSKRTNAVGPNPGEKILRKQSIIRVDSLDKYFGSRRKAKDKVDEEKDNTIEFQKPKESVQQTKLKPKPKPSNEISRKDSLDQYFGSHKKVKDGVNEDNLIENQTSKGSDHQKKLKPKPSNEIIKEESLNQYFGSHRKAKDEVDEDKDNTIEFQKPKESVQQTKLKPKPSNEIRRKDSLDQYFGTRKKVKVGINEDNLIENQTSKGSDHQKKLKPKPSNEIIKEDSLNQYFGSQKKVKDMVDEDNLIENQTSKGSDHQKKLKPKPSKLKSKRIVIQEPERKEMPSAKKNRIKERSKKSKRRTSTVNRSKSVEQLEHLESGKEEEIPTLTHSTPDLLSSRKNRKFRGSIFGFASKLWKPKKIIFTSKSDNTSEEFTEPDAPNQSQHVESSSSELDMTWIRELSESPDDFRKKGESTEKAMAKSGEFNLKMKNVLGLVWWLSLIAGRMPFTMFLKNDQRTVECKLDRRRIRYYLFLVTSFFIVTITVISWTSFLLIYFTDDRPSLEFFNDTVTDPRSYVRAERLLLIKQFPFACLFLLTFIGASAISFSFIFNGDTQAEYFTKWNATIGQLNFDTSHRLKIFFYIYFIGWLIQCILTFLLYFTIGSNEINSFREATDLITILILRFSINDVLLSSFIYYYGIITLVIFNYGLLCTTAGILLPLIYTMTITNATTEWNLRLGLILKNVYPKNNETTLTKTTDELDSKYEKMFDDHNKITDLVRNLSTAFSVILGSYYLTKVIVITAGLFDIALYTLRNNTVPFQDPLVSHLNYKYEKDDVYSRLQSYVFVIIPAIGFFITSLKLSDLSEAVYDGFSRARKRSLMFVEGTHEKRFIYSILMKSSGVNPYALDISGLFNVDRTFLYSFFALIVTIFSLLIQFNIPRLIEVPIIFECVITQSSIGICNGIRTVPKGDQASLNNTFEDNIMVMKKVEDMMNRMEMSMSTTPLMENSTTTMTTTVTTLLTENSTTTMTMTVTTPMPPNHFPCFGMDPNTGTIPESELYKCPGTEIKRFYTYAKDGMTKIGPHKDTMGCIFNPYSKEPTDPKVVDQYDCFGNLLTEFDGCGVLNFGHKDADNNSIYPRKSNVSSIYFYSYGGGGIPMIACFDFIPFYKRKLLQLEEEPYQCGMPGKFLREVCGTVLGNRYKMKPRNMMTGYGEAPKTIEEFRTLIMYGAANAKDLDGSPCEKEDQDPEVMHFRLPPFKVYTPYQALGSDPNMRRILLQITKTEEIFRNHRFAFAHPDLVKETLLLSQCVYNKTSAMWMHKLVNYIFDDCGGVESLTETGEPSSIEEVQFQRGKQTFHCYESKYPNYTCGVPAKIAEDTCILWKIWLFINKPNLTVQR